MLGVRLALDWRYFDPDALGGAVALLLLRIAAVELLDRGVVNVRAECVLESDNENLRAVPHETVAPERTY